jgi:hypothetical protein
LNGDQSFVLVWFHYLPGTFLRMNRQRCWGKLDLRSCAIIIDEDLVIDRQLRWTLGSLVATEDWLVVQMTRRFRKAPAGRFEATKI